jgi:hypothetical protein
MLQVMEHPEGAHRVHALAPEWKSPAIAANYFAPVSVCASAPVDKSRDGLHAPDADTMLAQHLDSAAGPSPNIQNRFDSKRAKQPCDIGQGSIVFVAQPNMFRVVAIGRGSVVGLL